MNVRTATRVPSPDIDQEFGSNMPAIVETAPKINRPPAIVAASPVLPQTSVAKIAISISAVMSEIGIIGKDGRNEFHRYDYAKMEDILQRLTPLMAKHGLVVFQTEVDRAMFDEDRAVAVRYAFTIVHTSGEVWPEHPVQTGLSRCRDSKGGFDDKSFNKAHTAARKYFLLALFQIATGDDDDADRGHNDGAAPSPAKSRVPSASDAPKPEATPPSAQPPHAFKAKNASEWAGLFIGCINAAKTAQDIFAWTDINADNLAKLKRADAATFSAVKAAIDARKSALAPAETITADGEIVPAKTDAMPSPIDDPEAAHKWIVGKLAAFKSYEAAETFWNDIVTPRQGDFFPPDFEDLMGAWRKVEQRLSP